MEEIFSKLHELQKEGQKGYLVIVTKTKGITSCRIGAKMILLEKGEIIGTIGGGEVEHYLIHYLLNKKPELPQVMTFDLESKTDTKNNNTIKLNSICGGMVELYIEPLGIKDRVIIFGAGHCAVELSQLAHKCGFYVMVVDNREEWANKQKHPYADKLIVTDYQNIEDSIDLKEEDYIVIMTQSHKYDKTVLEQILKLEKEFNYIGMMGSEYKVIQIFEELIKNGIPEEKLKKVFAPIGFPIQSKTPIEIAISITAQIIARKNKLKQITFSSNPLVKN